MDEEDFCADNVKPVVNVAISTTKKIFDFIFIVYLIEDAKLTISLTNK